MANFNKVFLMGNLTRDPQLRYLPSQVAVVDFGLAVNRRWTSKEGEKREETCFVDCRVFGQQAETINKYLSKGRPIFVEGRLDFDSWTAQDGTRRSKHLVTVLGFQFLGSAPAGGGGRTVSQAADRAASPDSQHGQADNIGNPPSPAGVPADDIPF